MHTKIQNANSPIKIENAQSVPPLQSIPPKISEGTSSSGFVRPGQASARTKKYASGLTFFYSRSRMRIWIGFVLTLILLTAVGLFISQNKALRRNKKFETIAALVSLKFPAQISQAKVFCTARGFDVLTNFCSDSDYFPLSDFKVGRIMDNPGVRDVEMVIDTAEGKYLIYARMRNEAGWKLDDIKIAEAKGKKINLWYSYIMEHPVLSFMQANSDDIVNVLDQTLDVANKSLEFAKKLKDLSDDGSYRYRSATNWDNSGSAR